MQTDFSTLVKDQNGDLPKRPKTKDGEVEKDDDGKPVMEGVEVKVGDHISELLRYAMQSSDNLKEISALKGIISDIARNKTEYSKNDITLIRKVIDEQLPLKENRKKPPIVLSAIADLLDDD